jgi:hypothetical protein
MCLPIPVPSAASFGIISYPYSWKVMNNMNPMVGCWTIRNLRRKLRDPFSDQTWGLLIGKAER